MKAIKVPGCDTAAMEVVVSGSERKSRNEGPGRDSKKAGREILNARTGRRRDG
jgi:hypothetical protein